jgi:hypothetical protein
MYLELILILEIRRALTIVTFIQLIKHCTRLHNTTFVNFRTWQETNYAEQTSNSRNPEPTEIQQVTCCPVHRIKEPRNRFQGINSASLCSLAGR